MIYTIPLKANPNQRTTVTVGNQNVTVEIYVIENQHLYANVYINSTLVIAGTPCNAGVTLNQYNTPLNGYLTWVTLDGYEPTWQDIGTNSFLIWSDIEISKTLLSKVVL